ncbi:MAG: hypothetical protein R3C56_10235 [Pirellulaceae bacterium]
MRRKQVAEDSLNISVHLVSGEVELAVCRGTEPIFLRLICIVTDDPQRVAEQVWMETQRCLTILPTPSWRNFLKPGLSLLRAKWLGTWPARWKIATSLYNRSNLCSAGNGTDQT